MKKRYLSIVLSVCLMAAMVPQTAAAQTTGDQQHAIRMQSETLTEREISSDDRMGTGTMSNQELFAGYVDQLFRGASAPSTGQQDQAVLFGEEGRTCLMSELDRSVYDYLRAEIGKIAAGERASTVIEIPDEVIWDAAFGDHIVVRSVNQGNGTETMPTITAEDLGVESILALDEEKNQYYIPVEAQNAYFTRISLNLQLIKDCLLSDLPYDLYWYDKITGMNMRSMSFSVVYDSSEGIWCIIPYGTAYVSFAVATDYQDTDVEDPELLSALTTKLTNLFDPGSVPEPASYLVDAERVQRAQTAAANARAIVEKYQDLSDSEKIRAYQEAICELTSYDEESLEQGSSKAGMDPWQLISVFDGDPATNVVCEGYAKAFQYLFEMSIFQSRKLKSLLVTGYMKSAENSGAEPEDGEPDVRQADSVSHMWSIVTMEDGKNYLVDVTNSDEDSVGGPETEGKAAYLVLRGLDGNVQDGYSLTIEKEGYHPKTVIYEYDEKTKNLFGEERLILSDTDYHSGDTIWQNEFEYTLDEDTQTITLTKYLGTAEEVTVPLNAVIGGKTYQSSWEESIFETPALVKVEEDLSNSLDEKYQTDLKITLTYAPKADEGEAVLRLEETDSENGDSQQLAPENFRAVLASYDQHGRMTGVQFLEPAETDQGIEFTGSRSGQQDQLMLLDAAAEPVMDSFVM